jgi:hypothetical protein
MPVLTRSQTLKMKENNSPIINNSHIETKAFNKVRPDPKNLLPWFIAITKEGISRAEKMNMKKRESKKGSELRSIHFDLIRSITETFYIINEYFPLVAKQATTDLSKLVKVIYNKVQDFYLQMRSCPIKPSTTYEIQVLACLIYTLQDVEKMIIPLLPQEMETKRIRNYVSYTGMADSDDDQGENSDSDYEDNLEEYERYPEPNGCYQEYEDLQEEQEYYNANLYYDNYINAGHYESYNEGESEGENESDQEPIKRLKLSEKNQVVKCGQHTWFY